jgi:hypothetical protein
MTGTDNWVAVLWIVYRRLIRSLYKASLACSLDNDAILSTILGVA